MMIANSFVYFTTLKVLEYAKCLHSFLYVLFLYLTRDHFHNMPQ